MGLRKTLAMFLMFSIIFFSRTMPAFFLMALEEDRLGVETRGIKYISNRLKV